MKPTHLYFRVVFSMLLALTLPAHAADKPKPVKYVAPTGFDGHSWGDLLTSPGFAQLPLVPIGIGAAWMRPMQKDVNFTCVPTTGAPSQMGGSAGGCDFQETLLSLRRTFEGGGFHVLSEYTIEDQGARYGSGKDDVVLQPVIYQFCANWDSTRREVPAKFDEMNKFCGVRLMFETETGEELRKLPSDYVTRYDRVLDRLVARFGKPDKFARRGEVHIETMEGEPGDRKAREFKIWRWCPARDRGLHTTCAASVVLSLEPETGAATVMYSTPQLWEFAYAREYNGYKGDKLFKLLHARK